MAENRSENLAENEDQPRGEGDNGWWQSWGKGWYDSIKEKSSATLELVQKDLDEFVSTIQHDAAVAVVDTANKVDEKVQPTEGEEESTTKLVKTGISKILTTVSDSLKTLTVDDEKTEERQVLLGTGTFADKDLNAKESRIYAIQSNPDTFSHDPEGLPDGDGDYQQWTENELDLDSMQSQMSKLLVDVPKVRAIYNELVPGKVSHSSFWQRYFYKLHQVNLEEERRAALIARVRTESGDDQLNWEDEDDNQSNSKPDIDESTEQSKQNLTETSIVENIDITNQNSQLAEKGIGPIENEKEVLSQEESLNSQCNIHIIKSTDTQNELSAESLTTNKTNVTNHDTNLTCPNDIRQDSSQPRPDSCDSATRPSVESGSSGSWESIDDNGMKIKASKHPHHISVPSKSPDITEVGSVASSGVLINRDDARSEDWEDLQDDSDGLEIEGDISEEELNKLVQQAKEKAKDGSGNGVDRIDDEDEDWENWE